MKPPVSLTGTPGAAVPAGVFLEAAANKARAAAETLPTLIRDAQLAEFNGENVSALRAYISIHKVAVQAIVNHRKSINVNNQAYAINNYALLSEYRQVGLYFILGNEAQSYSLIRKIMLTLEGNIDEIDRSIADACKFLVDTFNAERKRIGREENDQTFLCTPSMMSAIIAWQPLLKAHSLSVTDALSFYMRAKISTESHFVNEREAEDLQSSSQEFDIDSYIDAIAYRSRERPKLDEKPLWQGMAQQPNIKEFISKTYGDYLPGGISQSDIRRHDRSLYDAIYRHGLTNLFVELGFNGSDQGIEDLIKATGLTPQQFVDVGRLFQRLEKRAMRRRNPGPA